MTAQTKKISKGVLAGVAGGLFAAFVMDRFQHLASKLQVAKPAPEEGEPATVKAASAIARSALNHDLTPEEKKAAGPVMHYLMGGLSGGIYGAVSAIAPNAANKGAGTLFGAAVWLLADELAVPAFGLAKQPAEVPASQHGMALLAHLVYGLATWGARRALLTVA